MNVLKSPVTLPDWLPAPTMPYVAFGQRADVAAALIEHLELEAAEAAQSGNRRRREREDHRPAD